MKIELVDDQPNTITLDGYDTTAYSVSTVDNSRAVCLVYAGFGDGHDVAQKLVKGFNHHDELIARLSDLVIWGREYTSPTEPNNPHHLLVQAVELLKRLGAA